MPLNKLSAVIVLEVVQITIEVSWGDIRLKKRSTGTLTPDKAE